MTRSYHLRPLTADESRMLDHVVIGPRGQPRLQIDQQSFDLDNDGVRWDPEHAEWFRIMLAIALSRLVERERADAVRGASA